MKFYFWWRGDSDGDGNHPSGDCLRYESFPERAVTNRISIPTRASEECLHVSIGKNTRARAKGYLFEIAKGKSSAGPFIRKTSKLPRVRKHARFIEPTHSGLTNNNNSLKIDLSR